MLKTLTTNDYLEMPWKNGGGMTREIFRYPETGEWDFRVSIAQVDQSGPFSQFPEMVRHLVLLSGNGMKLTSRDFEVVMDRAFVPFTFSGELAIQADLIDGSNVDFNVFWKKNVIHCSIEILDKANLKAIENELLVVFEVKSLKTHLISDDQINLEDRGKLIVMRSVKAPGTLWD